VGGYSDDGHNLVKQELKLHPSAQRYEYGTQNEALYHGLGKAVDFVKAIGIKRIERHNRKLGEAFYQGLSEIPGVEVLSPAEEDYRTSLITFKIEGKNYRDIGTAIGEKNMRVRLVGEAGLDAVRVSFHVYNNLEEVGKILEVINHIARA
jgi:cysteine desulfurase/selenocysteine lyase